MYAFHLSLEEEILRKVFYVKVNSLCFLATVKLPVYVVGPEKIVSAVIGLITTDLSSTFVKIEKGNLTLRHTIY